MNKEVNKSIDLPLEEQFMENWGWEDSYDRYILDSEFLDMEYFSKMDDEDKICLIRKMENFLMERGLSVYFIRNYGLADQAFREMDKKKEKKSEIDFSYEW